MERLFERIRIAFNEWRAAFFTSGAQLGMSALSILSGVLTARYLLPEGKGQLTAAMLWPGLFMTVIGIGMGQAVVHHVGRFDERFDEVVGSAAAIGFLQGTIACIIGYFSIPYILDDYGSGTVWAARAVFLWTPIGRLRDYTLRMLQGRGEFSKWNALRLNEKFVYVGALVFLWAGGILSVKSAILALIVSEIVTFIVSVYYLNPLFDRLAFSAEISWKMLGFGVQNLVTSLVGKANHQADQAIISAYLPAESLGLYRVAVSASNLVTIASGGFKRILISEVSRADGTEEGQQMIRSSLKISAPLVFGAAVGAIVTAPYLIPWVFGAEYSDAVTVTQVMSFAAAIFGLKQVIYNGLRGFDRPDVPFYCEIAALVVTVVALYLLLPVMGILGAAVASLCAYTAGFSAAVYGYRRVVGTD